MERNKVKTNKFAYSLGLLGLTLITQLFHGFNLSYYVDTLGMSLAFATICKIIFVIVDSMNDVIFGQLSEKTKSKWGKRLPWLVYGAVFVPLFVVLTYIFDKTSAASISPLALLAFYIIISISVENASTVMYVNYNALFPTLFSTTNERNDTATFKHMFELVAMISCYVFTPILVSFTGSFIYVGIIYSAIYLICIFVCIKSIFSSSKKNTVNLIEEHESGEKYTFKQTLYDLFHNKPFLIYNIAQSFFSAIMALTVSMYPMYCKYTLGIDSLISSEAWKQSLVLGLFFGTLILSIPLWSFLIRKFTARKILVFDFLLITLCLFLLLIPNDWLSGAIVMCIVGPSFGGLFISPDMVSSELIDIDKIKHNVSREAIFGSIANIIGRISVIISALITVILTYFFGYNSGTNPGENPALTFKILFGLLLPCITLIGFFFAIYYYRLSRTDTIMLHELKRQSCDETTEVSINEILGKHARKRKK